MRFLAKVLSTTLVISLAAACGKDDEEPLAPANPDPRDVTAIAGGGTSGGSLDGVLTVFVHDHDGAPIESASVMVGLAKPLVAQTDAKGRVDFWDEALKDAATIHVFAAGKPFSFIGNALA